MTMLTPDMTFPAHFRTNDDNEAIVVGHHNGAYFGLVRADGNRLYPRAWTAKGQYRMGDGEGMAHDCENLVPPTSPAQIIWEGLTRDVRQITRSIVRANPSQSRVQIRMIRTLLSCGLTDTKEIVQSISASSVNGPLNAPRGADIQDLRPSMNRLALQTLAAQSDFLFTGMIGTPISLGPRQLLHRPVNPSTFKPDRMVVYRTDPTFIFWPIVRL